MSCQHNESGSRELEWKVGEVRQESGVTKVSNNISVQFFATSSGGTPNNKVQQDNETNQDACDGTDSDQADIWEGRPQHQHLSQSAATQQFD